MIVVAVPDEVRRPRAPRVVEAVVESPRNIADDPLHSLLTYVDQIAMLFLEWSHDFHMF